MRFAYLLCSYKPPTGSSSSPPKWKIPEKKTWININFQIPKITPKQLFWRLISASYKSYFLCIASITVMGFLGFGIQFFHAQYKLRSSNYSLLAIRTLDTYPQLLDILGPPVQAGHIFPYVKNGIQDDEVRVRMPITGKKSSGVLFFHAVKEQNIWSIRSMKFTFTDRAGGVVSLIKDRDEE